MNPYTLYLVVSMEIDKLKDEAPRRFVEPERPSASGTSMLARIRAALSGGDVDVPAITPALFDYPFRS